MNEKLKPVPIRELRETDYKENLFVVVDDGTKTYKLNLKNLPFPETPSPPEPEIFPDAFRRGKARTMHIGMNCTPHEGKWINDYDYDKGVQSRNQDGIYKNYSHALRNSIIIGECEFSTPTCANYGNSNNHAPTWMNEFAYTLNDAKNWTGKTDVDFLDFQRFMGGWYYFAEGGRAWAYPENWLITDAATNAVETNWLLPTLDQMAQLIGLCPRTTGNVFEDFKDFVMVAKEDHPTEYNLRYYKNISGFSMRPLGAKPNSTAEAYGTMQNVDLQLRNAQRMGILTMTVGGVQGLIFGGTGYSAHGAQVYLCRQLTRDELGYELYYDEPNDKIIMSSDNLSLPSVEVGLLRGCALRYANREHKKICASLSDMKKECTEIISNITYLGF